MKKPQFVVISLAVLLIIGILTFRSCGRKSMGQPENAAPLSESTSPLLGGSGSFGSKSSIQGTTKNPTGADTRNSVGKAGGVGLGAGIPVGGAAAAGAIAAGATKTGGAAAGAAPGDVMAPPPVKIFPELIPKNINIVRIYYGQMITGPGSSIEFDINGSGFTSEFQKMISVESGNPDAVVKNLVLVTPNQIHGKMEISEKSATRLSYPSVLITGKVVFQAKEPFAVIRPGEVLNLIFTEMGETGRTGRFRIFTNLTAEMFSNFGVKVNTDSITTSELTPQLPFVVDGTITIGATVGGDYDIMVTLKEKTIWEKKKIIRVVKPNVGQSGLIQKIMTLDGFHRPGDKARFAIQGSGFEPPDVGYITATVPGMSIGQSTFTYVGPGRLDLEIPIPTTAEIKSYGLILTAGDTELQRLQDAFRIVPKDWTRLLRLDPPLTPGGKSTLTLLGRDLDADFVGKLKVEVDEPQLILGEFTLQTVQEATAPISAGADVKPGDYLLHITSDGNPVTPEFGSIIKVTPP